MCTSQAILQTSKLLAYPDSSTGCPQSQPKTLSLHWHPIVSSQAAGANSKC